MMNETAVVKAALQYLQIKGVYCWRNNTGGMRWNDKDGGEHVMRFGMPGSADILGIAPDGRFVAVEAKYGKNKVSDLQRAFLDRVTQQGGIAVVVNERDYTDVIDAAIDGNWRQEVTP